MVEGDLGDSSVIMIRKTEKGSTKRRSRLQSQLEGYTKTSGPISIPSRYQTQMFELNSWVVVLGALEGSSSMCGLHDSPQS